MPHGLQLLNDKKRKIPFSSLCGEPQFQVMHFYLKGQGTSMEKIKVCVMYRLIFPN